jgi:hypothetical protein
MPGARCTRGLVCMSSEKCAHEHTGPPKSPGIPARNGFTDYHVLSLAHGLYGHHHQRKLAFADLTSASRYRDHTFFPSASGALVRSTLSGHRILFRVDDVEQRPS